MQGPATTVALPVVCLPIQPVSKKSAVAQHVLVELHAARDRQAVREDLKTHVCVRRLTFDQMPSAPMRTSPSKRRPSSRTAHTVFCPVSGFTFCRRKGVITL